MKLALAVLCLSLLPQPVGDADAGDNVMRVRYLPSAPASAPASAPCYLTDGCYQLAPLMLNFDNFVARKTFLLDNGYERVIQEIE
jgi:hypothetical protein